MSGTDPRLDRVIAALHTLEATQRSQSEVVERLQSELAVAQRDASAAREAAAFAKAETAAYQAELTGTARRDDLERLTDRLDAADAALAALHRNDAQAASVRDQVVKVSRALSKAASVADLTELVKRIEQIDDRLQVRMEHVEVDVASATQGANEVHSVVAQLAEDTSEFSDELERRVMALEAGHRELAERFDRVVVTAEAEIERVAGHLEKRLVELGDRVSVQESALDQVGDPGSAIGSLGADIDDLHRSLRVLRSTVESDRKVTRDLEQRVSGDDGLAPRLMQLAKIVVEGNERDARASFEPRTDPMVLELHGRLEDMLTRVERLGTLRSRVELLERHLDR